MSTEHAATGVPLDSFELRLRIARFHAGDLSAKEAALAVGVSGQTWRNWEQGVHADAAKRPAMLAYIAERLKVSPEWLRDGGPLDHAPTPNGGGGNFAGIMPEKCSVGISRPSRPRHLVAFATAA